MDEWVGVVWSILGVLYAAGSLVTEYVRKMGVGWG